MTNKEYIASLIMYGQREAAEREAKKLVHAILDAECKEPESVKPENTVVMTFEVTDVWKGETPMPQLLSAAAESRAEQIKSRLRADDVTVAKIQCFVRGAE